jgi:hypothetical protein
MTKRQYTKRTEEEMIADLEAKIAKIKERQEAKLRKDSPVLKKWGRMKANLIKFSQLAMDHDRADVANSVTAFLAGTDRLVNEAPKAPKKSRMREESAQV